HSASGGNDGACSNFIGLLLFTTAVAKTIGQGSIVGRGSRSFTHPIVLILRNATGAAAGPMDTLQKL
ncbi:MAG: hypothetical protein LUQ01_00270, partial [Methanolinea sp.]|nr:hypothetical protein [Methanolinea sp.]